MGLRLAACTEGRNPKMTPIIIENNTLRMIDGTLIATGQGIFFCIADTMLY